MEKTSDLDAVAGRDILFFDARAEGHHSEYVQHLVQYAAGRPELGELHFVYPESLSQYSPATVGAIRRESHCHLHELSPEEQKRIDEASLLWRSFVEWAVAMRYVRHVQADHCVLLELNIFQFVLGLLSSQSRVGVSGILFFPYPRIEADGQAASNRLLCWLKKLRKHLQLRWMLRNQSIETVFLLNDDSSAKCLNQFWPERRPFRMLPDPVPPLMQSGTEDQKEEQAESMADTAKEKREESSAVAVNSPNQRAVAGPASVPQGEKDRLVFLMFGALRAEKGVREVIEAFRYLPTAGAKGATLCLFGQVRADLEDEFPELITSLRRAQPDLHIQVEDRFLPESELHEALQDADVVLAPYLQSEGSSGVIGHAARYRTPVIGPNSGLVGALIEEYNLGETVEAADPSAIADVVRGCIERERLRAETTGMRTYVEERTPTRFAETIFDAVREGGR